MSVTAVIPLRYTDCFDADATPRMVLAGRPLWEITLAQAVAADSLDQVIVAHDDARFEPVLEPWRDKVTLCQRPPVLSGDDATTMDVLAFVADRLAENDGLPDYLMLLEITHPLRPRGIIDDLIGTAHEQRPDSLVTCYPVHYNFWRRGEDGRMGRISGTGEKSGVELYEELSGICSLYRPAFLGTDNPFGDQVNIVPIDRFWATIDVRDEDRRWLAEQYLKRTGAEV